MTEEENTTTTEPESVAEARKYRKRAQEAEAVRDAAVSQLESLRRSVIEQRVEADGLKPAALWASGVDLADLLDEEGQISDDLVSEAIGKARTELGIPAVPKAASADGQGQVGTSIFDAAESHAEDWSDVFGKGA